MCFILMLSRETFLRIVSLGKQHPYQCYVTCFPLSPKSLGVATRCGAWKHYYVLCTLPYPADERPDTFKLGVNWLVRVFSLVA